MTINIKYYLYHIFIKIAKNYYVTVMLFRQIKFKKWFCDSYLKFSED